MICFPRRVPIYVYVIQGPFPLLWSLVLVAAPADKPPLAHIRPIQANFRLSRPSSLHRRRSKCTKISNQAISHTYTRSGPRYGHWGHSSEVGADERCSNRPRRSLSNSGGNGFPRQARVCVLCGPGNDFRDGAAEFGVSGKPRVVVILSYELRCMYVVLLSHPATGGSYHHVLRQHIPAPSALSDSFRTSVVCCRCGGGCVSASFCANAHH